MPPFTMYSLSKAMKSRDTKSMKNLVLGREEKLRKVFVNTCIEVCYLFDGDI